MIKDVNLTNKIVIVTGGSRGIGRAVVNELAHAGAIVYFFYQRSQEQAEQLVAELKLNQVTALQVDVCDKNQIDAAVEKIYTAHDRIDILVNNSGIVRDGLLAGFSESDISDVLNTNLIGMFNMAQAVVPFMMRQRAGKIINMSSIAGEKPGRGQSNYAASKGAINAFTKALAVELAPRNILVNAIAPGIIETDISKEVREMGEDEALSKVLLRRFGKPEEVAHLVTFLASDYANYITGQIIAVDGGFKMA